MSTINKNDDDEFIAPQWLNKDFFLSVIQQSREEKNLQITKFELKMGASKNDHFASVMYRALVEYNEGTESKEVSLVLKTLPETGDKKELLQDSRIFETEIGMYTEIIPTIEAILRAVGDTTKFGPRVIYHSLSPKKLIVFEDLAPLGFITPHGDSSLEVIRAAYGKLAKFHAVSFKLIKEQPEKFKIFRHGMLKSFAKSGLFRNGPSYFIEMLGKHEDLRQYKPHFEALYRENLHERALAACEEFWEAPKSDAYYVLCHGDFHSKNFMLKCNPETDKFDDLLLLDFQLSYVGPIGHDLIFSMYTILNDEQRLNHFDELLNNYFREFEETLQLIGYCGPMPKFKEFLNQMTEERNFAICILNTFVPAWCSFRNPQFNSNASNDPVERHRRLFSNPAYLKSIRGILRKLLEQGFLEVNKESHNQSD